MFTVWKVMVVCGWSGREFRQNRGEMFMLRSFLLNSDKWVFIQEEFRYTTEENCLNSNLNLIKNYSFIPFYYFVSFCFLWKHALYSMEYLYPLQKHCLTHCSIAMKIHHDQGYSYEGKNFPGACLEFQKVGPLS